MKLRMLLPVFSLSVVLVSCTSQKSETQAEPRNEPKGPRLVEMSLEAQNHVGLKVAPAMARQLSEYLQVTGTVQPIDARITRVRPLARGRVLEVMAKVGDRVRNGQPLARFDNIEAGELASLYEAAEAELGKLKIQHATASKYLERNRRLAEIGVVPQKELESSRAEQQTLEQSVKGQESVLAGLAARLRRFGVDHAGARGSAVTLIRASFPGVVIKVAAAPGDVVAGESELFEIADLSQVWVQAEVYEKDLGRVRIGQPAFITVDTYPNERFAGRVTYVGDMLDPRTRTARVRCEVANPGTKLKLDMFAAVSLPTTFSRTALAVPNAALQQIDGKNVVFIRRDETKFELREVRVGKTVDGSTEILGGLSQGDPVVINGAFHLKSIAMGKEIGEEE